MESLVLHAFTTWHSGRLRNCELAFAGSKTGKYSEQIKDTSSVLHPTLVNEVCILVRGTANGGRLLGELHHLIVCLEHPASLCDSIQCPKAKKINLKKETRQASACGL